MSKKRLSRAQRGQLVRLEALPESRIDTKDIPEAPAANWKFARRGEFYRPVKKSVTIRLDADVLEWFKERGDRYQTAVNRVLRDYMLKHI
jgi:uncharacterized protein (DUF4415 family)